MKKYKLAPLASRLIAYIIDWYISALLVAIPTIIFTSIERNDLVLENIISNLSKPHAILSFIAEIILVTTYFSYPVILKKYDGQTIGKYIFGIKVIKADGNSLSFKDYFLRYVVSVIFIEQLLNNASFTFRSLLTLFISQNYVDLIFYIGLVVCAISFIMIIITKRHQMLHDVIANTQVIRNS